MLLTFNVYWLFWIHGAYKELNARAPGATRISPGAAVGRLFIPVYGLYWFFRLWWDCPRAVLRARRLESSEGVVLEPWVVTALTWTAFPLAVGMNAIASGGLPPELLITGLVATQAMLAISIITCERALYATHTDLGRRTSMHELFSAGTGNPTLNLPAAALFVVAFALKKGLDVVLSALMPSQFALLQSDFEWSHALDMAAYGAGTGVAAVVALRLVPNKIGAAALFMILDEVLALPLGLALGQVVSLGGGDSSGYGIDGWRQALSVQSLISNFSLILCIAVAFEKIRPTWLGLWFGFVMGALSGALFNGFYNVLTLGRGFDHSIEYLHFRLLLGPVVFGLVFLGGLRVLSTERRVS